MIEKVRKWNIGHFRSQKYYFSVLLFDIFTHCAVVRKWGFCFASSFRACLLSPGLPDICHAFDLQNFWKFWILIGYFKTLKLKFLGMNIKLQLFELKNDIIQYIQGPPKIIMFWQWQWSGSRKGPISGWRRGRQPISLTHLVLWGRKTIFLGRLLFLSPTSFLGAKIGKEMVSLVLIVSPELLCLLFISVDQYH